MSGPVSPGAQSDEFMRRSPIGIYAPQGRVPAQLSVPSVPSRSESRPDFARGFGLDIPEEEEEEEEERKEEAELDHEEEEKEEDVNVEANVTVREEISDSLDKEIAESDLTTTSPSKAADDEGVVVPDDVDENVSPIKANTHHKHPSRVSVALSVGSKKNADEPMAAHSRHSSIANPLSAGLGRHEVNALNEWTGSESVERDSDSEVSLQKSFFPL
jgi:hypothetical protein